MPIPKHLLSQLHLLEIKARRLSNHVFAGNYRSSFKGRGMSFKEVREYLPGDDVRFIDWNVSARFGQPFTRVFEEDRHTTLMMLIDVSASMYLGSASTTKAGLLTEIAATLAFSAISNNDKVGAVLFSGRIEKYIPPAKSKNHVLYLLQTLLAHKPIAGNTDLHGALSFMQKTQRHTCTTVVLSDFYTAGYEKMLKATLLKHDGIGIHLADPHDQRLPKGMLLPVADAETGEKRWIDTTHAKSRTAYSENFQAHARRVSLNLSEAGWDHVQLNTNEAWAPRLHRFFLHRSGPPRV